MGADFFGLSFYFGLSCAGRGGSPWKSRYSNCCGPWATAAFRGKRSRKRSASRGRRCGSISMPCKTRAMRSSAIPDADTPSSSRRIFCWRRKSCRCSPTASSGGRSSISTTSPPRITKPSGGRGAGPWRGRWWWPKRRVPGGGVYLEAGSPPRGRGSGSPSFCGPVFCPRKRPNAP